MANIETIPAAVIESAKKFADEFVKNVDCIPKLNLSDSEMVHKVWDVCRVLGDYHSICNVLLDMLTKRGITEQEYSILWNILSKYAPPIDPKVFYGKGG